MWLYLCMQLWVAFVFLYTFILPLTDHFSQRGSLSMQLRLHPCLHFSGIGLQAYAIISSPFFTSLPYTHTYVFLKRFIVLCVWVLSTCMHVYLVPEAIGVRSHGTGVTDNCELPCGFWGPNLGPGSSAREAGTLNHWVIFPALPSYILVAKSLLLTGYS